MNRNLELYKMVCETFKTKSTIAKSFETCGSCKSNHVTFVSKQTRSADEAATIFYTCSNCHKKWRA